METLTKKEIFFYVLFLVFALAINSHENTKCATSKQCSEMAKIAQHGGAY